MEYIVIGLWALIFGVKYANTHNANLIKLPFWILCVYCVLLFGFRYRVGFDTINYMDSYPDISPINKIHIEDLFGLKHAPLYGLIESSCKMFSPDFFVLQIVVSTLFSIPLFWFLKKESTNPFISFLVFFFISGFYFYTDILRESLAIACFLLNYDNFVKRRYIRFYILALISVMLHYSAIILFLLPLFPKLGFNRYYLLYVICFIASMSIMVDFMLPLITIEAIANQAERNLVGIDESGHSILWRILKVCQLSILPIIVFIIYRLQDKKNIQLEKSVCLYALLGIGCLNFDFIFARFANYFAIPFAIYFGNCLDIAYLKGRYIYFIGLISILCISYLPINIGQSSKYIPYYSIFNPQEVKEREDRVILWRMN